MTYLIPENIIIIWPGTNASIPTGWSRETSLDGKFIKGSADLVDPGDTGGASTHSHNAAANHTHSMTAHSHTLSAGNSYNDYEGTADNNDNTIENPHTHTGSTSTTSGGELSSVAATYSAVSNDPPHKEVIFIKSAGTQDGIPNLAVLFSVDSSFVSDSGVWDGFFACDGNNSTPALGDKFLKGAGSGQNAGTDGGSSTNIHTLTHTHSSAAHYHTGTLNATVSPDKADSDSDSADNPHYNHTHSVTTDSVSVTLGSAPQLTTAETVEPAFRKLLAIQNRSGGNILPTGIVGLWLGSLASIPLGWALCDGDNQTEDMREKYLKSTATPGEVGDIGGSNTHTHASQTHTHTSTAHSHSFTVTHTGAIDRGSTTAHVFVDRKNALHNVTSDSVAATFSSETTSASSSNNEPTNVTIAFVKFLGVWTVDVSESITVTDSPLRTLVNLVNESESVSVSENVAVTVRDGLQVSIWKEEVTVSESVRFPGPNDLQLFNEPVSVSEKVTIKLESDLSDGDKPSFGVIY